MPNEDRQDGCFISAKAAGAKGTSCLKLSLFFFGVILYAGSTTLI
jgi:hypothetical protein